MEVGVRGTGNRQAEGWGDGLGPWLCTSWLLGALGGTDSGSHRPCPQFCWALLRLWPRGSVPGNYLGCCGRHGNVTALVFPRACPGVEGKPCLCLLLPLSENSSRSSSQAHLILSGFSLKAPAQRAPFSVPHWLLPHYLFYCPHSIIVIWRSRTCLCFCFVLLASPH